MCAYVGPLLDYENYSNFWFMKSSMNTHDEAVEIDSVDRQPRIVFLFGRRSVIN